MQSATVPSSGTSAATVSSSVSSSSSTASVRIQFRSIGNAPVLRKTKFKVGGNERIYTISKFLKSQLNLSENDSLWLYVPSTFAPAPDDTLGDLNQAFGIPLTTTPNTVATATPGNITMSTTTNDTASTSNNSNNEQPSVSTETNTVHSVTTSAVPKAVEKELILYYSITNAYG